MGKRALVLALLGTLAHGEDGQDYDLRRETDQVGEYVAAVLGAPLKKRVEIVAKHPSFLRKRQHAWIETPDGAKWLQARVAVLKKLRVVHPNYDPVEDIDAGRAPGGLYTPAGIIINANILPPAGWGMWRRVIIAHELVHAHRDQHGHYQHVLRSEHPTDLDWRLAASCLVEGDAELFGWWIANAVKLDERPATTAYRLGSASFPKVDKRERERRKARRKSPVANYAYAPYIEGAEFAFAIYHARGLEGLEKAFANPPRSMEQVLHPKKYLGPEVDEPVEFEGGDVLEQLGPGWTTVRSGTIGEFDLRFFFQDSLGTTMAWNVAEGWDGSRFHLYAKEGRAPLYVMFSTWDSEADAREFVLAWCEWAAQRDPTPHTMSVVPSAAGGERSFDTKDGRVVLMRRGHDVIVLDGLPEGMDRVPLLLELWKTRRRERTADDRLPR